MSVALLDVNILVALSQTTHIFHSAAEQWFQKNRSAGWASCMITQSGYVLVSALPSTQASLPVQEGWDTLAIWCSSQDHQFWHLDYPLSEILPEIRRGVYGYKQLTDAILLDLAIRRGGRLVTFDRRLRQLLPEDSPHQNAIEVIAV